MKYFIQLPISAFILTCCVNASAQIVYVPDFPVKKVTNTNIKKFEKPTPTLIKTSSSKPSDKS